MLISNQEWTFEPLQKKRTRNPAELAISNTTLVTTPEKFTSYIIDVSIQGIIPFKTIQWQVPHRYSEFYDFHSKMQRFIAEKGLQNTIVLPSKTLFKQYDPPFVAQRRVFLQHYLRLMYTYFDPADFPEFDTFLLYDLYVGQAISEAEVVALEQQFIQQQQQQQQQPQVQVTAQVLPLFDQSVSQIASAPLVVDPMTQNFFQQPNQPPPYQVSISQVPSSTTVGW